MRLAGLLTAANFETGLTCHVLRWQQRAHDRLDTQQQ